MLQKPKLKELSFLVYGLGLSGCSVVKFFKKKKINNFKVWDDYEKKLYKNLRAKNLKKTLITVDYIVLAPGISLLKNKKLNKFKKKIITDIDLLYLANKNFKSIVVTGTNGKSTTCKLIAHLLKKKKIGYSIGGNIGTPILNLKNPGKGFIIIEASSFQLSHSKFICPNFAFFLNFSNDHIDWHGSKKNYLNSKLKIFQYQTKKNYAIVNRKFKKIFKTKSFSGKLTLPSKIEYKKIKNQIKNNYLASGINDENMSFVFAFAKLINMKKKSFIEAMSSFKGLPHRFEIFLKKGNYTFINDSKATSFKSTQLALSNLKNIYWILGGLPKKGDKIEISKLRKNIIKCYLIGQNINFFKKQIKGKLACATTKNLKRTIIQLLKDSRIQKNPHYNVLLSPSAASFDQFTNFEKRGEEFKRLCKIYGRKYI